PYCSACPLRPHKRTNGWGNRLAFLWIAEEFGVLRFRLMMKRGPWMRPQALVFNGHTHEQFIALFHAIGSDPDNRVVILTGSANAFMESITLDGFDFFTPQGYDKRSIARAKESS